MNSLKGDSAHRFVLLDALRGLAAIFVLFRHTGQFWHFGFYRSYLAVDLFFLLSGFVIAFAYDEKLRTGAINLWQFLTVRLIRMYPVYLLSLGLCLVLWWGQLPWVWLNFVLALFFLPWPVPYQPFFFGVNGPYWSLFFELVANLLYGLLRPVLSRWVLAAVLVASGLGVAAVAFLYGNLDTGWQWSVFSALAGLTRAVFGVFLGVLLYRSYPMLSRWAGRLSPWAAFLLVALILASPSVDGWNSVIDLLMVFVLFPLAVLAASQHRSQRGRGFLLLLGAASYPVYVMHQQVGQLLQALTGGWVEYLAPWSGVAFVVVLVVLAAVLERKVDVPLRQWLRRRLLS